MSSSRPITITWVSSRPPWTPSALRDRIRVIQGVEVTSSAPSPAAPWSIGHHNAWPIPYEPLAHRRGAPPNQNMTVADLYASLRHTYGARVVQLNHPREANPETRRSGRVLQSSRDGGGGLRPDPAHRFAAQRPAPRAVLRREHPRRGLRRHGGHERPILRAVPVAAGRLALPAAAGAPAHGHRQLRHPRPRPAGRLSAQLRLSGRGPARVGRGPMERGDPRRADLRDERPPDRRLHRQRRPHGGSGGGAGRSRGRRAGRRGGAVGPGRGGAAARERRGRAPLRRGGPGGGRRRSGAGPRSSWRSRRTPSSPWKRASRSTSTRSRGPPSGAGSMPRPSRRASCRRPSPTPSSSTSTATGASTRPGCRRRPGIGGSSGWGSPSGSRVSCWRRGGCGDAAPEARRRVTRAPASD